MRGRPYPPPMARSSVGATCTPPSRHRRSNTTAPPVPLRGQSPERGLPKPSSGPIARSTPPRSPVAGAFCPRPSSGHVAPSQRRHRTKSTAHRVDTTGRRTGPLQPAWLGHSARTIAAASRLTSRRARPNLRASPGPPCSSCGVPTAITLLEGDCLRHLAQLPAESFDLVVTSPRTTSASTTGATTTTPTAPPSSPGAATGPPPSAA